MNNKVKMIVIILVILLIIILGLVILKLFSAKGGEEIYESSKKPTVNIENIDLQTKKTFNSTFEAYSGEVRGIDVRDLLKSVKSSNNIDSQDKKVFVNINSQGKTMDELKLEEYILNISTSKKYFVELKYQDGIVNEINIVI